MNKNPLGDYFIVGLRKFFSAWNIISFNLTVIVALFIIVFACLEIWARGRYTSEDDRCVQIWHLQDAPYRKLAKNLPNYRDHYESLFKVTKKGFKYYDYYDFAVAPIKTKTINFTDYFSSRLVPDSLPLGESNVIVWLFGGSTMMNLDAPDDITIANYIARELRRNGVRPSVFNFGTMSFQSSLEFVKFSNLLSRVSEKEVPQFAIFYDGFNDPLYGLYAGPGNIPKDISVKIASALTGERPWLRGYSLFYDYLFQYSVYWKRHWHFRTLEFLQVKYAEPYGVKAGNSKELFLKILDGTVNTYLKNVRMSNAVCHAFNIQCLYVLQPMLFTKTPLNSIESELLKKQTPFLLNLAKEFYKVVSARLEGKNFFIDMSLILNGSEWTDFYDIGHTSPITTPEVIGKRIAREIFSRVK